jgi:predicted TIM-barrel fold metal-dependent hydrolase
MPIFDAHAYLETTPFTKVMATAESVLRTQQRHDVAAVVLISGLAARCDFVAGNRRLREVLHPASGIYGYVVLNADYPEESQQEMQRYLLRREFVASVLFGHDGNPVLLDDVRDLINAQRRFFKPVAIHTPDADAVHAAREIAAEFPTMKFLLLGMGGDFWTSAISAAKQTMNLYLEVSGSLDSDKIAHAAATLTPRKLIFGSSMPHQDISLTVGLVEDAPALTQADRSRIFYHNALSLFNTKNDPD